LRAIDDAMVAQSKVTIVYQPEGRREEARDLVPQGYLRRPGSTFLLGRCDDGNDRQFKVEWITRAHMAQATLF
jgi:predicted DNA-binding transcriptional regulator YafY